MQIYLFLVGSVFVLVPQRLGPSDNEILNVYIMETELGPSLAFLTRLLLAPFDRQGIIFRFRSTVSFFMGFYLTFYLACFTAFQNCNLFYHL